MEEYKSHIEQTRTGNVGSSDSRMLQQIAELGQVPKSAMKRMAIIKGLRDIDNVTTKAMRLGDYIEETTFANLQSDDARWESNKFLKSEKYSRKNCGCLTHIDYWLQDDEKKVITIGEQKATLHSYAQAYDEYKFQIYHHYLLTKEYADKIGYKVKVLFSVYDTNGVEEEHEYDPQRLTVKQLRNLETLSKSYLLSEAMDIVDTYLETMTEYLGEGEEVESQYLPEKVKEEFETITNILTEIKEREKKVEDFKSRLFEFMQDRCIRSIKNDRWAITRVDATEAHTTDFKALFEQEIEAKTPRVAKRLKEKYKKVTKRKGSVQIRIKKDNDNNNE